MKPTLKHFFGGSIFLALGIFARKLFNAAQPGSDFVVHPLATDRSGLAVELNGWIGLLGFALIGIGLLLMVVSFSLGYKSGRIEAFVKAKLPKKKPKQAEGEDQDEADDA
jgi:hypothetical protein